MKESDLVHIPYTEDMTEGGMAHALRSLPFMFNARGRSIYDRLRRSVVNTAVELAFRRYLSGMDIPFEVKGAMPFTNPEQYDVVLGGRRCEIKSFFISHRNQIAMMERNPHVILNAPALVPSDQNAGEGHSFNDIYLFAFVTGYINTSHNDLQEASYKKQPYNLVHIMPGSYARPQNWVSLGRLFLKSESAEAHVIGITGQVAGREMRSLDLMLPPGEKVRLGEEFFSIQYVQSKSLPNARIGIHSESRSETHLIGVMEWGNIWVHGLDILLAGWLTREEFNQHAAPLREGARVFQYARTRTKNLFVPVRELRTVSSLLKRVLEWNK